MIRGWSSVSVRCVRAEIQHSSTGFPGRLEIDHLSKRYGDVVALRDTTFDVRAGELFGFVGSHGAGKTTTMRIALGVLVADSGEVCWNGERITLETRRHIGYMPENAVCIRR